MSCNHDNLKKHGKDRKGCQRWRCRNCGTTVTDDNHKRPLGDMRTSDDDAARVLAMLLEGMSIRACSRVTGIKADTICDLVLLVGQNCERFLTGAIQNVPVKFCELDEIWGFVGAKAKTAAAKQLGPEFGDSWSWFAIDADSKLIVAHTVGDRDQATCVRFLKRLNNATSGPIQITSDGLSLYTHTVPMEIGLRADFAQLIKHYSSSQTETRYSPATITGIDKVVRMGNPDERRISTSYSERFNLSVRMHVRRFTRLTNAHSKRAAHHAAMVALFVTFYNFCRKHETLKGRTPAMAAGLTVRQWSLGELVANVAA